MTQNEKHHIHKWSPDLSVGIPIIDDDHKGFFEIVNLISSMIESGSIELDDLNLHLLTLEDYVIGHFNREEKFLSKGPRAEYLHHKHLHDQFRQEVKDIVERCRAKDEEAVRALPGVVSTWIVQHIRKVDAKYESWVSLDHVDNRPLGMLLHKRAY